MSKFYFVRSKNLFDDAARMAYDGKSAVVIWDMTGLCNEIDADGKTVWYGERPRHMDAVEIWPAMTAQEMKNARRIAATRGTLRRYEERADALLAKGDAMTDEERADMIALINVAYHGSGKIEGVYSIDGCASCEFCRKMIAAAADNVLMICGCCYAARDSYKEASWRRHTLNARILSSVLFTAAELSALCLDAIKIEDDRIDYHGALCRFNEDGDTVNQTHAQNLLRIAETRPGVRFGYWYKNAPAVEAALHAEGIYTRDALPENVRFVHSSALIGFEARALWFDDIIFTVYPTEALALAAVATGAHECNGRRCRACGFTCYLMQRRTDEPLHVAETLRCSAPDRARIVTAYEARKQQQAARCI